MNSSALSNYVYYTDIKIGKRKNTVFWKEHLALSSEFSGEYIIP